MTLVVIIGIFPVDGQVCTYYNFNTHGKHYGSGDIVELPRHENQLTSVVILGIHENISQAQDEAHLYFKRLCRWDDVDPKDVKVFGHDLGPIEEEVSQIALFETQGIEGPLLSRTNTFELMGRNQPESTEDS
ncbi:uncharacterized protein LOC117648358 [Thrips palmi]|uniref:Uncharacterized protein LOC117648358 n=1 Tax=Thrips palmi TaxID=161013 RepID=A0A6P8ZR01_THRPL|nr:uncharacterized protein LOC117648358 [Thrips palmi]